MLDKASCREWAQKVKADPAGFTAHKFGFPHTSPKSDDGRDLSNRLLSTKVTLGGEAKAAAGPVGRTGAAQTDAAMTAEILSYSRTRGVFAGVSLTGATLREDDSANKDLYGKEMSNKTILTGGAPAPEGAGAFNSAIRHF